MSPPSSTWTLRAVKEVVSFDSALSWFESLKAEGWKDEGGGYEGAAQPGEPGARISNGEFTAQYSESLHPLSIFVSDRISDEFFSED